MYIQERVVEYLDFFCAASPTGTRGRGADHFSGAHLGADRGAYRLRCARAAYFERERGGSADLPGAHFREVDATDWRDIVETIQL